MSAVELAIQKIQRLDEAQARHLLAWLETQEEPAPAATAPRGARDAGLRPSLPFPSPCHGGLDV